MIDKQKKITQKGAIIETELNLANADHSPPLL